MGAEAGVEQHLHKRVEALGGEYRRFKYAGRRGANDDLILIPGRHRPAVVECKAPGEVPTKQQAKEHEFLAQCGFDVFVCDSIESVDRYFPLINRRK